MNALRGWEILFHILHELRELEIILMRSRSRINKYLSAFFSPSFSHSLSQTSNARTHAGSELRESTLARNAPDLSGIIIRRHREPAAYEPPSCLLNSTDWNLSHGKKYLVAAARICVCQLNFSYK